MVSSLGSAQKGLSEEITFLMHRFTVIVGFGGPEIDRLVANRANVFGLSGLCHNDTSWGSLFIANVPETSVERMVNCEQIAKFS